MCTRAVIKSEDKTSFLTGRTMDWSVRFNTNLWAFPAGIKRSAGISEKSITWTSQFRSITAGITLNNPGPSDIHMGTTSDGMNEKGLVVNSLWLSESDYGKFAKTKHAISMGMWVQFMLDKYANVKDAVLDWGVNKYRIKTVKLPGCMTGNDQPKEVKMHLSLSDEKGYSAIFEYYSEDGSDNAKLHITTNIKKKIIRQYKELLSNNDVVIHHSDECDVMTNSPVFCQQLKLNYYWKWQWEKGMNDAMTQAYKYSKVETLPGTSRAPDRFARISYYLKHMNVEKEYNNRIGQAFSLMRTVAVPFGSIPHPEVPNVSNTLWTTVADHEKKRYYFESTDFPNLLWIDLLKVDLDDSSYIWELPMKNAFEEDRLYAGNVTSMMKKQCVDRFQFVLDDCQLA